MSRSCVLASRLVAVGLLTVATLCGSLWAYVGYEVHRARRMFDETSRVHIGDSEASILPLVQRYRGFKWTPEPLGHRENWLDKEDYDYQKNRVTDYNYELDISPFIAANPEAGRWTKTMRITRGAIPARLQPLLGMRDWRAWAKLSIRSRRVRSVTAMTIFEGRSEWLGDSWELADGMPRYRMPRRAYVIGVAHLTMEDSGGTMIQNFLEPKASEEEVESARQFKVQCLTSIRGCNGLCEVAPRAIGYLKQHPYAAWNIVPPNCP